MKIEHRTGNMAEAFQVLPHGANREIADGRIRRAGVQRIRRMRKNRRKVMLRKKSAQCVRILLIEGLNTAAARVAREKLKRIRTERKRLLTHRQITL